MTLVDWASGHRGIPARRPPFGCPSCCSAPSLPSRRAERRAFVKGPGAQAAAEHPLTRARSGANLSGKRGLSGSDELPRDLARRRQPSASLGKWSEKVADCGWNKRGGWVRWSGHARGEHRSRNARSGSSAYGRGKPCLYRGIGSDVQGNAGRLDRLGLRGHNLSGNSNPVARGPRFRTSWEVGCVIVSPQHWQSSL